VGEMIREVLNLGVERIVLGVGGSATVDGGIGALGALGVRFKDELGFSVPLKGEGLLRIKEIDLTGLDPRLKKVSLEIATDVKNPLLGPRGASRVYGPQKGATEEVVEELERGLENLARLLLEETGMDVSSLKGGGAAGGIPASFRALLNAEIHLGIDLFLDLVSFDEIIEGANLVITGEGKLDRQTTFGKGVIGVSKRAKAKGIPVFVLAGWIEDDVREELFSNGVSFIYPILRSPTTLEDAIENTKDLLSLAGREIAYLLPMIKDG